MIDNDPFENTHSGVAAQDMLNAWASMFGSAIANIQNRDTRDRLIRQFAELQHELIMGLDAAELVGTKEEAIEQLVKGMTDHVAQLLPIYDIVRKRNAANNN